MSLLAAGNIDPGRLDRRCILSYPLETRDSVGGVDVSWIETATVWAAKVPTSGGRLYAAEAKHYEQQLTYRIRHRTDCRPGWRLTHGDDVFEITNVSELGRGHYLELELRAIDQSTGHATITAELLHDGSALRLHDGELQVLHESTAAAATSADLLHDGSSLLLHDGSSDLLHAA